MIDITRTNTQNVSTQLETVIKNISSYDIETLRQEITRILTSEETQISASKASEYLSLLDNVHTIEQMYKFVTNTYLAGANMSYKKKKY